MVGPPPDTRGRPIATPRLLNGRYELGELLGTGGMSEVRRGVDTILDRPVAVKLFRGDLDRRSEQRFTREARILARLQHPNVVTVFDVGADRDERFIVMELVEGTTLRQLLDREGSLEPERASGIAEQIATALGYAHERDVVHRDVKPSNVLLATDGRVKLADLGIAKILTDTDATATTGVFGTFSYMAPEQARGDAVDARADIYALGCVFFEMLTGHPPFEGDGPAVLYAHAHDRPPSLRSVATSAPVSLDTLVASMLAKDPSARPSAREVGEVLSGGAPAVLTAPAPTVAEARAPTLPYPPVAPTERLPTRRTERVGRRRPSLIPLVIAGAALVLAGLLVLAFATANDEEPTRRRREPTRAAASPTREPTGSPDVTTSPSPEPTTPAAPTSPEDAAAAVLAVLDADTPGEITGRITGEVHKKINEILRELPDGKGAEKALEKIADLRAKVAEAVEKGEISSPDRAAALDEALERLAATIA